jgi:hypothetical protein
MGEAYLKVTVRLAVEGYHSRLRWVEGMRVGVVAGVLVVVAVVQAVIVMEVAVSMLVV